MGFGGEESQMSLKQRRCGAKGPPTQGEGWWRDNQIMGLRFDKRQYIL